MSCFSKINQDDIDRIRRRYQIPDDVVLRIPDSNERACCPKYEGDIAFYKVDLKAGLRFPMQPFVRELLDFLSLAPGQVALNGWQTIISCMVMWRVNSNGQEDLTVDEFIFYYEPCQIALSPGFWTFKNRDTDTRVVQGLPSSDRIWKDRYFFVCGDNWERLPQENLRDFVRVRKSWGTPSSPGVCFSSDFYVLVCHQYMTCFTLFCSIGSSVAEFRVEGKDIEGFGDRGPSVHYLY